MAQSLTGDSCGIRIQESCGNGGENDDQKTHDTKSRLHHDLRDITLSGIDGSTHTDQIHPAADHAVYNSTHRGRFDRLLRFSCIITDQWQPG